MSTMFIPAILQNLKGERKRFEDLEFDTQEPKVREWCQERIQKLNAHMEQLKAYQESNGTDHFPLF